MSRDVPRDHADFGKAFPCPACAAPGLARQRAFAEQAAREAFFRSARIPARFRDYTFERYAAVFGETIPAKKADAYYTMLKLVEGPVAIDGVLREGVVLSGKRGVGKTVLAACWANANLALGRSVLWLDTLSFVSDVQDTYSKRNGVTAMDLINAAREVDCLILDDMGNAAYKGAYSNDRAEKMYLLLNYRHGELLPTVITTNLGWSDIGAQFDLRLRDKIYELSHWVVMDGADMRYAESEEGE